jgi:RNA polymerase sigma-70 factor (ECF subfamily)
MLPGGCPERRSEIRLCVSEQVTLLFGDEETSGPAELLDLSACGFRVLYTCSALSPATLVRGSQPHLKIRVHALWSRAHATQIETGLVEEGYFLRDVRSGKTDSLLKLIDPCLQALRAKIRFIVRDPVASEDVLQETLTKVLQHAEQCHVGQSFRSWLFQIATNEAFKYLRKRRKYRETDFSGLEYGNGHTPQLLDPNLSPEDILARKEFREALAHAASALEQIYLRAFLLRDIEELEIAEVAALLGISVSATHTRLHRAHLRLRRELGRNFSPGAQSHAFSAQTQGPRRRRLRD